MKEKDGRDNSLLAISIAGLIMHLRETGGIKNVTDSQMEKALQLTQQVKEWQSLKDRYEDCSQTAATARLLELMEDCVQDMEASE